MKNKKYNSVTFHQAAAQIVEKYCGEIPGFELETNCRIRTFKKDSNQLFRISYEHKNLSQADCLFYFFVFKPTPGEALQKLENDIQEWFLPEPKTTPDDLTPFDFSY